MERAEWLSSMRSQGEALYDRLAPAYWVKFGLYPNPVRCRCIKKFLARLKPHSYILDAACGAGRYDGILVDAGHAVLGIDQSTNMLARAREVFPQDRCRQLQFRKLRMQEMDFHEQFDGVICVDGLDHVSPEDWPDVLMRLHRALKSGGVLYVTLGIADPARLERAYERARAAGLPVVAGEVVADMDGTNVRTAPLNAEAPAARGEQVVYHYFPALEQAHAWFAEAGLVLQEEGTGDNSLHLLLTKRN